MSPVSTRLLALGVFLARRYGPAAASTLARTANAWLADPANGEKKRRLVEALGQWSQTATGRAASTAAALARQVELRRVSPAAWERDLMDLRHELPAIPRGPERDAATRAYEAQLRAGVHLISGARRPERAREEVLAALRAERAMIARERLGDRERERLMVAVDATSAACAEMHRAPGG
jgi:hypothetical protein